MLRYPLRLKLGAFAALLFFTAALVVVGLVSWRQESLSQSVGGDAAWHAYKLDRDTVQLRNYLNLPDRHVEGLRLRFELLYSRLPLLRTRDITELISTMPVGVGLIAEIENHMDTLDQLIQGLERLDSDSLVLLDGRLQEMAGHTERLVIAINGHLADSATRERQQLQQLYGLLLVLILAMSLAALMVVVILFREGRDNAIARRTCRHGSSVTPVGYVRSC
ncbi:hypothetical protein [Halomonas sp.]|uniref:hypothetical protein n=1 Tax=Halomonas sp. TaxID=1486246 RepID=UPI00356ACE9F